ncbi:MAG: hypothetical protein AAF628_05065 [Planctomycetota bacterium]
MRPTSDPVEAAALGSRRWWVGLLTAAAAWRALISWRTPIPAEDGANYVWMAEQFAAGRPCQALGEVFPPLTGAWCAWPIWLGLEPFRAAQLALAVAGVAAVVWMARAAERLAPGAGRAAAWLTAFAPLPVRLGAECYSEPVFLLFGAAAVESAMRHCWWRCGALAGAAAWVRPEAALIIVALMAAAAPRRAWRAGLTFAAAIAVLSGARGACGLGFDPWPKVGFVWERSVAALPGVGEALTSVAQHALRLPWLWLEAFGLLGVLAVWGACRPRRPGTFPLVAMILCGAGLICFFLPRRRFLVSWLIAAAPLAAAGWLDLPRSWRRWVLGFAVVSSLALGLRTMHPNRAAERAVGQHLGALLAPGERVTGDMTRVLYFAGQRPLPPRPWTAGELASHARPAEVRFVVLGARRPQASAVVAALAADFDVLPLPAAIGVGAADRGILVLQRRH